MIDCLRLVWKNLSNKFAHFFQKIPLIVVADIAYYQTQKLQKAVVHASNAFTMSSPKRWFLCKEKDGSFARNVGYIDGGHFRGAPE